MKSIQKYLVISSLALMLSSNASAATSYNNMFISYESPSDIAAIVKYASTRGINNFFFWTYSSDTNYTTDNSLLKAVNNAEPNAEVGGYWADWEIYSDGHAIPGLDYPIANNDDLATKLKNANYIVYSFLETQTSTYSNAYRQIDKAPNQFPQSYGSVYFFDTWADLSVKDDFCLNTPKGLATDKLGFNLICSYSTNEIGLPYLGSVSLGNFEAFAKLGGKPGKNGKPIETAFSIGGYAHDASFEEIFNPQPITLSNGKTYTPSVQQATANFVNSIVAVMQAYNINTVDLDYEAPNMTHQQSLDYLALITALSHKLADVAPHKHITLAIMASPQYIQGIKKDSNGNPIIGFANGVLADIAKLPNVKAIDLMTYDFHGAYDYNPVPANGSHGKTGFLTNLYMPSSAPQAYDPLFSVQSSIDALLNAGVPASKIGIGLPSYSRGAANLTDPGVNNTYLFSEYNSDVIIPGGDIDEGGCNQAIYPNTPNSCNGMFSYRYITEKMLGHGFTATEHMENGIANGTTAFAKHWEVPNATPLKLTLSNSSQSAFGVNFVINNTDFGYVAPNNSKLYDNTTAPKSSAIAGQTSLTIQWTRSWGSPQSGYCLDNNGQPAHFDFNKDTSISFTVNASAVASCIIK